MESYNNSDNVIKLKNTIYSKSNLQSLINKLETLNKKKLIKNEIYHFINFIKEFNYDKLYKNFNTDLNAINENFIKLYMSEIGRIKSDFDIHEFLKQELNGNASIKNTVDYNFGNLKPTIVKPNKPIETVTVSTSNVDHKNLPNLIDKKDQIEFAKILNYQSLWRDSNILIDSRYQSIANQDRSRIVFSIVSNTKAKTPGSGVITSISNMRDIVEIEIFPFSIPYMAAADNYYKKITLSILELASISIDTYEDSQFHFMFNTTINGNLIDLYPINKVFRFFKPIARINEFTLRFGSPLTPIIFDKDRLYTSNINYATNPGVITFLDAHNLITGDLIYIQEFTTSTPAIDLNLIEEINSSQGHICTRISNTSISINVDFTQIVNPIGSLSVLVYLGSKRVIVPIKFRYLIGDSD